MSGINRLKSIPRSRCGTTVWAVRRLHELRMECRRVPFRFRKKILRPALHPFQLMQHWSRKTLLPL